MGDVESRSDRRSSLRRRGREFPRRKAFALLVQCHAKAGDGAAAAHALAAGRGHYPADAELLFLALPR